ncbi:hypothetical protein PVAND_016171 [Polypedilum vanderplanki]|uniref:Uncharacterized protein n=1 Tax=Polypedilum vanderplanki TaxID=319348 RepID=A0A9J6BF34_POLVA|nr:hypothetical protein PVAND_016171 [Polypedilum vanderplanki]QLB38532.1 transmembrane protein LIL7 [Polypedilum vanderplanki]
MSIIDVMKVDNFLGCFRLESGGFFIATFGLLTGFLQLVGQIIFAIFLIFVEDFCLQNHFLIDDRNNYEIQEHISRLTNFTQEGLKNVTDIEFSCEEISKTPLIIALIFAIIFNTIAIFAHYRLIKGLEELNFQKFICAIGFYIFCIVYKILFFIMSVLLSIFVSYKLLVPSVILLILTFIDTYMFIVINTIRVKIENPPHLTVTRTPTTTLQAKLVDLSNTDIETPVRLIVPE